MSDFSLEYDVKATVEGGYVVNKSATTPEGTQHYQLFEFSSYDRANAVKTMLEDAYDCGKTVGALEKAGQIVKANEQVMGKLEEVISKVKSLASNENQS